MTPARAVLVLLGILAWMGCAHKAPAPSADGAQVLLEKGKRAAQGGNHRMAVALFTQAVAEDPDLADAYNERGKSNVQLRLLPGEDRDVRLFEQNALDDFTLAVQKNSSLGSAYFNRAMILASRAQFKLAAEDLLNASRNLNQDPEPERWLGYLYEEKFEDRTNQAMEHYLKYVDLGGTDPAIVEKVKAWKATHKPSLQLPPSSLKVPTEEDERKAAELHSRLAKLLGQPDTAESIQIVQQLLTTYGNTKYVQGILPVLRATLIALEKQKGAPK